MTTTTIHPNGTSRDRLIEKLCEASEAMDLAYEAIKRTAPNPRDYGADSFSVAGTEHFRRLRRVDDVKDEIDAMIRKIEGGVRS